MTVDVARLARKGLDGLQYGVAGVAAVSAVVAPASVLLAGDLVPLKWTLFLFGLLAGVLGSLKLRPTPGWREEPRRGLTNERSAGGFGATVAALPPVGWLSYDGDEHLSDGGRLLALGVLALAVSFALEVLLGVGVPRLG